MGVTLVLRHLAKPYRISPSFRRFLSAREISIAISASCSVTKFRMMGTPPRPATASCNPPPSFFAKKTEDVQEIGFTRRIRTNNKLTYGKWNVNLLKIAPVCGTKMCDYHNFPLNRTPTQIQKCPLCHITGSIEFKGQTYVPRQKVQALMLYLTQNRYTHLLQNRTRLDLV